MADLQGGCDRMLKEQELGHAGEMLPMLLMSRQAILSSDVQAEIVIL